MNKQEIILLLIAVTMLGIGCSKNSSTKAAQTIAHMEHDPSRCPHIQDGYYTADQSTAPMFIEIYNDPSTQQIEVNMNGFEELPANGRNTPQANGGSFTTACVDDSLRIVGKDSGSNFSDTTITVAADGGLNVNQNSPKMAPLHYTRSGALKSTIEQFKKWFTPSSKGSGLPQTSG